VEDVLEASVLACSAGCVLSGEPELLAVAVGELAEAEDADWLHIATVV
jgi:hypothetical protein